MLLILIGASSFWYSVYFSDRKEAAPRFIRKPRNAIAAEGQNTKFVDHGRITSLNLIKLECINTYAVSSYSIEQTKNIYFYEHSKWKVCIYQ
jgi:hypothetical protein